MAGLMILYFFLMYAITFDEQTFYIMLSHLSFKNFKKKILKLKNSTENSMLPVLKYNILNC